MTSPIDRSVQSQKPTVAALTIGLASAFLIGGYECIRSASNTIFKEAYGIDNFPLMIGLSPIFTMVVLLGYGKLLDLFGARKTLVISSFCAGTAILLCCVGVQNNIRIASALLFLTRESYPVVIVGQYWSYFNSVMKPAQAKSLSGILLAISTCGGILGAVFVSEYAVALGSITCAFIGGIACFPAGIISNVAYSIHNLPSLLKKAERKHVDIIGLKLFGENRMLLMVLFIVLASQFYSAFTELNFQRQITATYADNDQQTAASALFFAWVNGTSVFLQVIVSPFLLKRISLLAVHRAIPIVHGIIILIAMLHPNLWTAGAALLVFKSVDYSIFRSAKEILYMPFSFDVRFRAKQIIDSFGYRSGKGLASLMVSFVEKALWFGPVNYLVLSLITVITWAIVVWPTVSIMENHDESLAK